MIIPFNEIDMQIKEVIMVDKFEILNYVFLWAIIKVIIENM